MEEDFDWTPVAPEPLHKDETSVFIDFETDGLRHWAGDRPIGAAILTAKGSRYYPWGHRGGGNLSEQQVKEWFLRELPGKRIENHSIRFEVHMALAWGVDLEAMGCTLGDSSHWAALLDDHRKDFKLDTIGRDFLGMGKIDDGLNKKKMAEYHAGRIADYACQDVNLVAGLKEVMWPMMTEQGLHEVRELEEEFIWCVCEMERNGAPYDGELRQQWEKESESQITSLLMDIYADTGILIDPGSVKDKVRLFRSLNIPITEYTETGQPSFTDEILKHIPDPNVQRFRRIVRLQSLRAKYIVGDKKLLSADGLMRYAIHQLRAEKAEGEEGAGGTVSGRCSSSAIVDARSGTKEGCNIQQRIKVAKQRVSAGYRDDDDSHDEELFLVRRLHIEEPDYQVLSSDMMQVEYRYFAHLANTPSVIQAYKDDPFMSFHKFTHELFKVYLPDLPYRRMKDVNFAKVYGAGIIKLAVMLGYITKAEWLELQARMSEAVGMAAINRILGDPRLATTIEINKLYDRILPEVKPLLKHASTLAKERGYVKTMTGRRMRFPDGQRLHKALNGVIQGSCADIMKRKTIELHKYRKETGFKLRFIVHDEVVGGTPSPECTQLVHKILNTQSFNLRVPIHWETGVGPNWAQCVDLPNVR